MRLERVKNFITYEECSMLNAWADEGVAKQWLKNGRNLDSSVYTGRATTRFYGSNFTYPDIVLQIANRIAYHCGILKYPIIAKGGQNGIVVSAIFTGGHLHEHVDEKDKNNNATLRCNILTRAAERGGELYVDNTHIALDAGELHCYLASEHSHYVTQVEGATSRVLWMFGAHVPKEHWDNGLITLGEKF
jgi:hypothetical protein